MTLLNDIVVHTGMSGVDLLRIIETAPLRYKQYPIPKRSGGTRLIAQPSRELKLLQRFVAQHILEKLPVHKAAMAYVQGRNILDNARAHSSNPVILKLDFENFFHSIKVVDFVSYFKRRNIPSIPVEDMKTIVNILFWGRGEKKADCLSIGAPTSPLVSNIILFEIDKVLFNEATKKGIQYTRYADDITVSGPSISEVTDFEKFIKVTLSKVKSPYLKFNEKKRGVYTKGMRRLVTGLVLTPDGSVSIGRDRKRAISSLIHKFSHGELSEKDTKYLNGMLGFAIANEPEFIVRMRNKYGNDLIEQIQKIVASL